MEFRVLGPLEVEAAGRKLDLGSLVQRRVLAALLLHPDREVPLSRLVAAAWDGDPPATAARQVRNRVADLRALLTREGGFIDSGASGYWLRVGPGQLDALVFAELAARGLATKDAGLMRDALALWRGPALDGLGGDLLGGEVARLAEQRLALWEECLDLDLAAGGHARVVDELAGLVAHHPTRERLVGLLMVALHRCGRRDEALVAYRELADRLADELGVDPSRELRDTYGAVTADDGRAVPAQLPADVRGFSGRVGDLARLDQYLSDGQAGRAVVISAIAGTAGVGKTSLAVHWAHRVRDKFPDGQLYANLRGFDPSGSVVNPAGVLRRFLTALDVPPERIPADPAAQAALYRELLAGRRMLILLDNARDADQVRPLLAGGCAALILVTSRNRLSDLDGARPLMLDVLTRAEARQLLAGRLGADRVAAELDAADAIIDSCARLPLALAVAAARAVDRPEAPLASVAAEIHRARSVLDALAEDDAAADVRAVLSWSYQLLSPAAARLFRLLSLPAGADVGVAAAASLAAVPVAEAGTLLAELTGAHLLAEQRPGRYGCHDLLRAYAAELAATADPETDRGDAVHRVLDHYVHTAYHANVVMNPHLKPLVLPTPRPGVVVADLADPEAAIGWMDAEHPAMVAAVGQAAAGGYDDHAWRIPWQLGYFFDRRGHLDDWYATHVTALAAARRRGDREGQAYIHRGLAGAYARLNRLAESHPHLRQAADMFRALGDHSGEARTHLSLAYVLGAQGRHEQARHHGDRAFDLYRRVDSRDGQAISLSTIGHHVISMGDPRQGLAYLRQALAMLEELGNKVVQISCWRSLGYAHRELGEFEQSASCLRRGLDIARELGDAPDEADLLARLGDTHLAAGDPGAARAAWEEALAVYDRLDHPDAAGVRSKLDSLRVREDAT